MTDKEKIRVEVLRLKDAVGIGLSAYDMGTECGVFETCEKILQFIDSLPEEPVSEDLFGIAMELEETIGTSPHSRLTIVEHLAKAANWQKKKTIKWLTAFNNEHEIISYTDSHCLETDELIEYFKNYMED